jgi:hypothetical protein
MTTRPRTAQAQRCQQSQETSIPLTRTKSIPTLRRPQTHITTSTSSIPPPPLGISRAQSQVPVPLPRQGTISRKPSIPLRQSSMLIRKVSSARLRSPAPLLPPPVSSRGRERKPLPTRSLLPTIPAVKSSTSTSTLGSKHKRGPPSPSIHSVPVVNRLNRKASIPILPRAGYIVAPAPSALELQAKNQKKRNDEDDENVFQGGQAIVRSPTPRLVQREKGLERLPVQRMVQRGVPMIRPDYLEQGVDLLDCSLDLIGSSPLYFYW